MDTITAKPNLLKKANLSLIRKVIKSRTTATRAEIVNETHMSTTTVRSLLSEMQQNGEIESIGYDESSGGRKAARYRFKLDRYYCAAFCITGKQAYGLLVDIYGEIIETTELEVSNEDFETAIISYLDQILEDKEIKSIGIGVPGIVENGSYLTQNKQGELYKINLGLSLEQRYHIPVFLENDLNATAIGFGRCYLKEFPDETPENTNMAYLYFEYDCISAGFISGGKVIRGCNNYAGELGLLPIDNDKTLCEHIAEPMDNIKYTNMAIQIICWICGILNPQYVALGGPALRKELIGPIGDGLSTLLPNHMLAEILYAPDVWHDYHDGMAYLTAGKMFDEIQFVKE